MRKEVVFDVNIFVSYIIGNRLGEIFDMVFNRNIRLYRNAEMRAELIDVISRTKFQTKLTAPVAAYVDFFEKVTIPFETVEVFKDCPDPKDNYLFDLAYQTNSNYLVSGDKKVLATPVRKSLSVISLSIFKKDVLG
ncbi:MAG: putative toxin-antitoxin system toxin component, PIN family [Bacteroidetes bacterium]|nr:putative toxin-antitoxin system toxin component, PIN family [Bacteroidota bacterium]